WGAGGGSGTASAGVSRLEDKPVRLPRQACRIANRRDEPRPDATNVEIVAGAQSVRRQQKNMIPALSGPQRARARLLCHTVDQIDLEQPKERRHRRFTNLR